MKYEYEVSVLSVQTTKRPHGRFVYFCFSIFTLILYYLTSRYFPDLSTLVPDTSLIEVNVP